MKLLKKAAAMLLTFAFLLCAGVCSVDVSAASAGDDIKGNTLCEALQMDGAAYMNWLMCHEHDSYYLGTPYAPYDHRNPQGDCTGAYGEFDEAGVPGMNCQGFIWHVLYKATGFSDGKMDAVWRAMSRFSLYRGLNLTRRYFKNKKQMLDSGYLEKGDLIWMIVDQDEELDSPYHHIGIYWGDGHSDLLWHSNRVTGGQGECNAISKILPELDRNTMYIVLKVGAKTLTSPRLTAARNTPKGIEISWDKLDGAVNYRVFRGTPEHWVAVGDTTDTSFTYTGAAEGDTLCFTVRGITACGKGYTSTFDSKGIRCQRHTPDAPFFPAIETCGDYEYAVTRDGSAQIVRYKGAASAPTVPAALNGRAVKAIGDIDPDSKTSPFSGAAKLTQITLPAGMHTIGSGAFAGCDALTRVVIPASVTCIGDSAFAGCRSLAQVTLPDGVETIGADAFRGCVRLKHMTIPAAAERIGDNAFSGCTGIEDVTILNGVQSIGSGAFSECCSLMNIVFPSTIATIGDSAFYGCSSLEEAILLSGTRTIGSGAFNGCRSLASIVIPATVTRIGDSAFFDCGRLQEVTVRNGSTDIGDYAFGYGAGADKAGAAKKRIDGVTICGQEGGTAEAYADANRIPFTVLSTEPLLFGDLNNDGKTDNRDAVILDRFIAGWAGYAARIFDRTAADLDGDGVLNNRDAMILDRYVSGWDGYEQYFY